MPISHPVMSSSLSLKFSRGKPEIDSEKNFDHQQSAGNPDRCCGQP